MYIESKLKMLRFYRYTKLKTPEPTVEDVFDNKYTIITSNGKANTTVIDFSLGKENFIEKKFDSPSSCNDVFINSIYY